MSTESTSGATLVEAGSIGSERKREELEHIKGEFSDSSWARSVAVSSLSDPTAMPIFGVQMSILDLM